MNVLLIEPDRVLASVYAKWLTAFGYTVQVATGAQSAVIAADKQKPDVVVLELQLARHNGIDFLYEFRSYSEWQHVPVVIHSVVPAESIQLDGPSMQALGIAAYLYKPTTTLVVLARTIKEIVGKDFSETANSHHRHRTIA